MRKLYYFLALAVMFTVSALNANAEKRYVTADEYVEAGDIQPGVKYALKNAATTDTEYLYGSGKTDKLTDGALYEFVEVSINDDGYPVYKLKANDGQFLMNQTGNIQWTNSDARSWTFVAKPAVAYVNGEGISFEGQDWSTATTITEFGATIFSSASYVVGADRSTILYLCGRNTGNIATLGNDSTKNAWVIYPVEELTGMAYLQAMLGELFTDDGYEIYAVGDQPGQISQELYDELKDSYEAALALMMADDPAQEDCLAAIERCENAIRAAKDGAIKVAEGYYFFGGWRTAVDENGHPTNATYEENAMLRWTYSMSSGLSSNNTQGTGSWEYPEGDIHPSYAKYIWILMENPEFPGSYFIQNYETKRYVGRASSYNDKIHSTENAEESYFIYPISFDKTTGTTYFAMECASCIDNPVPAWPADGGANTPCRWLHQAFDHDGVMMWTEHNNASNWTFFSITEDDINTMEEKREQYELNRAATELLEAAKTRRTAGFAYVYYTTEVSQYWTNAQEADEGPIENICDGRGNTFFHTDWHGTVADQLHYVAVDLGEAVDEFLLTLCARGVGGQGANDAPDVFQLYGANEDPRDAGEDVWELIDGTTADTLSFVAYTDEAGVAHTADRGRAQQVYNLPQAYRYIKFEPAHQKKQGAENVMTPGTYWNCGELKVSPNELVETPELKAVPKEIRDALDAAIENMELELEDEMATQETIDALQVALDNYINNYPYPERAQNAIDEAKAQAEAAEEGDQIGYFEEGAIAALTAALTKIEQDIKEVMTVAEINDIIARVNAAMAEFNSKLRLPEDGLYYIKSETEAEENVDKAANAYLYIPGTNSNIAWRMPDAVVDQRYNCVWDLKNNADGTVTLKNIGTGQYIPAGHTTSGVTYASWEGDTCAISLQSAKVAGLFNLVVGEKNGKYLNAQPGGGHAVVTWGSASGRDNSAFSFVPYTEPQDEEYIYDWAAEYGILTLPFSYTINEREGAEFYEVIGHKGLSLELKLLEDGTQVEAGMPVILKGVECIDDKFLYLVPDGDVFQGLEFVREPGQKNGLVGVFEGYTLNPGEGYLYGDVVVLAEGKNEYVATNRGYFGDIPETTETGDLSLVMEGYTEDGIASVIANANLEGKQVYTIAGVRFLNTKNLPAGLYIVNGKKMIIK